MTRAKKEEILRKAIGKAVEYGYFINAMETADEVWCRDVIENGQHYVIIFSHDFAEAFAKYLVAERKQQAYGVLDGTFPFYRGENREHYVEELKKELLREMVVKGEPLEYLGRFLGEK